MTALWVLAGVTVVLLVALAVPVDVAFALDTTAPRPARLRIAWLWGAVGGEPRASEQPQKPRAKRAPRRRIHVRALLTTPGFERRVLAFLRRMFERLHARVELRAELGLTDPASTAELFGFSQLLRRALATDSVELAVHPHFDDERLELHGQGEVRAVPLVMLADVVGFALSPVTLRALRRGLARGPHGA